MKTLREGRRPAALLGPPGLGKTLLLHLVGQRLDDRLRSVYLPYAALPLDELCAWALSLLGFSQSDDTIGDLIQTASHLLARGSGLLLLIDDASAMPLPTARKLGDLVAASRGRAAPARRGRRGAEREPHARGDGRERPSRAPARADERGGDAALRRGAAGAGADSGRRRRALR